MHEVSLVTGLARQLEDLCREHGATRVVRFELEVGAMANVVPELLSQAIDLVSDDVEVMRRADFTVVDVALEIVCTECASTSHPATFDFSCPQCGSGAVRVTRGEELLLRDVELELAPVPGGTS